jgi:mono/diheme cytochrome c family protein
MRRALIIPGVIVLFSGCITAAAASTITYENGIRQLLDKHCLACHGSDSPTMEEFNKNTEGYKAKSLGPRFDTYENLMVVVNGTETGALMRRLDDGTNTKDGKPGNMFKNLGNNDARRAANLAIVKQWIGGWTLKRATDISEAEKNAIRAPRN